VVEAIVGKKRMVNPDRALRQDTVAQLLVDSDLADVLAVEVDHAAVPECRVLQSPAEQIGYRLTLPGGLFGSFHGFA
jgi:hypothetical protein